MVARNRGPQPSHPRHIPGEVARFRHHASRSIITLPVAHGTRPRSARTQAADHPIMLYRLSIDECHQTPAE